MASTSIDLDKIFHFESWFSTAKQKNCDLVFVKSTPFAYVRFTLDELLIVAEILCADVLCIQS